MSTDPHEAPSVWRIVPLERGFGRNGENACVGTPSNPGSTRARVHLVPQTTPRGVSAGDIGSVRLQLAVGKHGAGGFYDFALMKAHGESRCCSFNKVSPIEISH